MTTFSAFGDVRRMPSEDEIVAAHARAARDGFLAGLLAAVQPG